MVQLSLHEFSKVLDGSYTSITTHINKALNQHPNQLTTELPQEPTASITSEAALINPTRPDQQIVPFDSAAIVNKGNIFQALQWKASQPDQLTDSEWFNTVYKNNPNDFLKFGCSIIEC